MSEHGISGELKACNKCGEHKPLDEYYIRKPRPERGEKGGIYGNCKKCHCSYTVERAKGPGKEISNRISRAKAARRREILWETKSVPCLDCDQSFPPYVMDFDHRDKSQKEFTIAAFVNSVSLERLLLEIDKCDIVCANCHRIRTHISKAHMNKRAQESLDAALPQ